MTNQALVLAICAMMGWLHKPPAKYLARAEAAAPLILKEAAEHGLDPLILAAVMLKESSMTAHAVGRHGEVGLMQILPRGQALTKCRGLNLADAGDNVKCGARLLAFAKRSCETDNALLYLGRYTGVRKCVPSKYARKILALMARGQRASSKEW